MSRKQQKTSKLQNKKDKIPNNTKSKLINDDSGNEDKAKDSTTKVNSVDLLNWMDQCGLSHLRINPSFKIIQGNLENLVSTGRLKEALDLLHSL